MPKKQLQCRTPECDATIPIAEMFPTDKELRDAGWIHLDGDVFCPRCSQQALADKIMLLL